MTTCHMKHIQAHIKISIQSILLDYVLRPISMMISLK